MSKMSSLGIALSGLSAAQAGLYVTGHNMSNVDTTGYTRQRVLQHDFLSLNVGTTAAGIMQVGLGTDISAINQIRNKFLDVSYRDELSKGSFYGVKAEAGAEIETILGEMQSDYRTQAVIDDLWEALNELSNYQSGLDTRGNFISTATTFLNKANNVYERLYDYQHNLNDQVKETVIQINNLVEKIATYNLKIKAAETAGDKANDYRDTMNLALDELSGLLDIEVKTKSDGTIDILVNGNELLSNGNIQKIGFKYTSGECSFVEPVFTASNEILPVNSPPGSYRPLYNLTSAVTADTGKDNGKLLGLLVTRGYEPATYASPKTPQLDERDNKGNLLYTGENDPAYKLQQQKYNFDAHYSFIPKVQREFDTLVNSIVTMLNDAFAPYAEDGSMDTENAPYGLDGTQTFQELFVRKYVPRFDENGNYIEPDINDYSTLYTLGNIEINPVFSDAAGYSQLALSKSGDIEDNELVLDLMAKWQSSFIAINESTYPQSVPDAYRTFLIGVAAETDEAYSFVESQNTLVVNIDNKRKSMSGVSLDEEMTNMLRYQHSFNAASRIVNVIDSMLDKIINSTGRSGL